MDKRFERYLFGGGVWWWLRHLFFWMFVYFDELLFTFTDTEGFLDLDLAIIPLILDIVTVYFNLYVLIPAFLNEKKHFSYFSTTILSVVLNVFLAFAYSYFDDPNEFFWSPFNIAGTFIATLTLLATAIAIKVGKYSYQQLKVTEELKFEQSKLELNYLKQQINPHFLFNVLNTIHIQSKTNPDSVSETVLHLSDLLRYQIYDAGTSDKVLLTKEIDFLKNYTSLEELRRNNLHLEWLLPSSFPKIKITPFLFLPLIENAFKHSRSINEEQGKIKIVFQSQSDELSLVVSNTIGDTHEKSEGGFGIDNLKKRLDLLYPGQYHLDMSIKDGMFISSLNLKINEGNNN